MSDATRRVLFDNLPYMLGWEEYYGKSRFTGITVGQCVSVIPVRRASIVLEITLIRETRLETVNPLLKAVGGYLRGQDQVQAAHRLLRDEAGLACKDLHLLVPKMEGFTVIELPIATYLAVGCTTVARTKAKIVPLLLDETVDLVLRQEIPDQCTADAIMRIALLEARNQLPL